MPIPVLAPSQLKDRFGRVFTDLRISVTDRCNLRCSYCIPEGADDWFARADLLTPAEFARLAGMALRMGVTQIRITGGEPLLRPDLEEIVALIRAEFDRAGLAPKLALTTNAIGLEKRAEALRQAGLERINISIDTLNRERFKDLTKRDHLERTLAGIEAAAAAGLTPVKLNTVIIDADSVAEIPNLVKFAVRNGYQWRAIEFMPIGPLASTLDKRPDAADIMARLRECFSLEPLETAAGAPARRWTVAAGSDHPEGIIGVIASTSAPFCKDCERTRLSANGRIYSCLFSRGFVDLAGPLRAGASDEEIMELWAHEMWNKPAGHQALAQVPADYRMSQIGG